MDTLDKGVWFQSAISGLHYKEYTAAGTVCRIIMDGLSYYPNNKPKERSTASGGRCVCGGEISGHCAGCPKFTDYD